MEETAERFSGCGGIKAASPTDMDNNLIEVEKNKVAEVAPALIAVHPFEKSVVVAVGSELRIFNLEGDCAISLSDELAGPAHSNAIRAFKFGADGKFFVSAGDDKLVKIWETNPWHCIRTVSADKRVSAVAISHNGQYVAFADKFGVVWLTGLDDDDAKQPKVDVKAVPILGHYCSIITRLEFSPDDRFIASADRDYKIRITVFPKRPLKGAHEIQSFCLGHTDFVSCLAFVCPPGYPYSFLLSGSGDSTVRLWDFISGTLLASCEVGAKAGSLQPNGIQETRTPVNDLCASFDGSIIAASLQSLHGIALLSCDFSERSLSVAKVVSFEDHYFPTSLGSSSLTQHLWTVMGASNLTIPDAVQLSTRVRVISCLHKDPSIVLEDDEVPGGHKLLSALQGGLDVANEQAAFTAAAAAVKMSMRNMLIKKEYTLEKREMRKRNRNDRKLR